MLITLHDLPSVTDSTGLPACRIEPVVAKLLESKMAVTPTGVNRERYLDLMERLIRTAAKWQDANGAIIDPVQKEETGQTSPRFVAAASVLLHFGRIGDLREQVYRGMDYCCRRLADGEAQSPDFWMRELMTAWMMIADDAPAKQRTAWDKHIRSIDPEHIYWHVEGKNGRTPESLHNWTIYAAAGEGLRELVGLAHADPAVKSGLRFWDKYIPSQFKHFTDDGMYRDPNDPFTYDMTTRLQYATPLMYGLKTSIDGRLHELLRRGALTELLYASPDGFAPFGGRSAAFNLQECIFAAMGELEARRYKQSNPRLASAFKRHARLGVKNMSRWLEMTPHRHLKNGFDPSKTHGCEEYGHHGVYTCFAASCLGLAALWADESIPEAATPAEIGGYVMELTPAFHKVFAAVGQTQIEIDTAADFNYDATGLGRFHRAGVPLELGVSMPFPAKPKFHLSTELLPKSPTAIGPAWKVGETWTALAELSEGLTSKVTIGEQSADKVSFTIDWQHGGQKTQERYTLTAGRLSLEARCPGAAAMRMIVPILDTDGDAHATTTVATGQITVTYRDRELRVNFGGNRNRLAKPIANRNGIYRPLMVENEGDHISIELCALSVSGCG